MAKKSIGTLSALLTLDGRGFTRGIDRAQGKLRGFGSSLKTVGRSVLRFGSVLAGVAGGFSLARMVRGFDDIAKTSVKLGVGVEALQEMQFAAKLAGISVGTFNMALQRMRRRLGEAAMGAGEALKAIQQLGLDPQTLGAMGAGEQLRILADALTGVEDPASRLALAFKFFDSEGVVMLNILDRGAAGLDAMAAQANRMGVVMSGQTIKSMETFNETLTLIGQNIKGQFIEAIEDSMGSIDKLNAKLKSMNEGQQKNRTNWVKLGLGTAQMLGGAAGAAGSIISSAVGGVARFIGGTADTTARAFTGVQDEKSMLINQFGKELQSQAASQFEASGEMMKRGWQNWLQAPAER